MFNKTNLALALVFATCGSFAMSVSHAQESTETAATTSVAVENTAVETIAQETSQPSVAELTRVLANIDLAAADEMYNLLLSRQGDVRLDNGEGVFYTTLINSGILSTLNNITNEYNGIFGVVVLDKTGLVLLKDNSAFPLASTVKLPIAYAVAHQMLANGHDLNHTVELKIDSLNPDTHSPLYTLIQETISNKAFSGAETTKVAYMPKGVEKLQILNQLAGGNHSDSVELTLGDLIYFTVALSDNNTCDYLLTQYLNSPADVEAFLQSKGLSSAKVQATEANIQEDVEQNYLNTMSVYDISKSLVLLGQDSTINADVRNFIFEAMHNSPTGVNRIQAGVQAAAQANGITDYAVFDKSGSGAINASVERVAVNDVAFVNIQGEPYVISVFVKDLIGEEAATLTNGEQGIAKITTEVVNALLKR